MGWRRDEVWFEIDVLWFREQARQPFVALALELPPLPSFSSPAQTGLDASRRRRLESQAARKRRLATRTVPAVALVLGSASMLSFAALRPAGSMPSESLSPVMVVRCERRYSTSHSAVVRAAGCGSMRSVKFASASGSNTAAIASFVTGRP